MKRLVLAFLLVGLVTLLVPSLRERIQPRIDEGRAWLGVRLEGPMSPVLTPYRRLKTQSQMRKAVNELIQRRNMGFPPPRPTEFRDFIVSRDAVPEGVDAWGSPFLLEQGPDSLTIVSAGPDYEYDTPDDLTQSVRYVDPAPRRRGPRR